MTAVVTNTHTSTDRKTDVTVRLSTYGTHEQLMKTLDRLERELELSGFNAEIIGAFVVQGQVSSDCGAA